MPSLAYPAKPQLSGGIVLLLITLFALLATGTLSYGVAVYRNLTDASQETYFQRTALSYLSNQVRTMDSRGALSLTQLEDTPALLLQEEVDGQDYLTYLYYYDGALRQLSVLADTDGLAPDQGLALLAAGGLTLTREGKSLACTVWDTAGVAYHLTITPRCGWEEAAA